MKVEPWNHWNLGHEAQIQNRMVRSLFILTIILTIPFGLEAQKEIEVHFDYHTSSLSVRDSAALQVGDRYRLKIYGVNAAYIQDHTSVRSYRYISPIPEILEPILPGIPGSDVFDHFDIRPSGQREFFLKSLRFFNEMEVIRSESDDLYTRTRFYPDPALATQKMDRIHATFDTTDLQYIAAQVAYYRDYILAAESIYNANVSKVTLMTPDADIVIREQARLSRIADKILQIDYVRLLGYIAQSTVAYDFILTDIFTARNDVTEVRLALYDSYLSDTIYTGFLDFDTQKSWSFDFSTGFFLNTLYQKEFFLAPRNDEVNDVLEESKFRGDLAVGALAHLTYRFHPDLRIGPAIGASISPFDGKVRYLLGISGFVGKQNIVGVSTGLAIGQVNVLSGSVVRDGFGPYLPENVNKIPTFTRTNVGFYLGLTYNFTRYKKP